MSFEDFLANLETSGAPEITCIFAQTALSIVIIYNIRTNSHRFPIRQLSPLCTIAALFSFQFVNIISAIARYLEQNGNYYNFSFQGINGNCGQCRAFNHPQIQALAVIYTGLRDLPLVLFSLKTVRVCVCFLKSEQNQLPEWLVKIFSNESIIILLSLVYSFVICLSNYLDLQFSEDALSYHSGRLTFELLCPKQSGTIDWIATIMRYILLAVSYTLSIKTYKQLDFKRFIFLIFLLSNTQVIVRVIFVFLGIQQTTYHEFYYHSLLLNLIGTVILYPYSNYNLYVQQPPGTAILQNFDAFINYNPGCHILSCFAEYRDRNERCCKFTKCFDAFISVRQIKMIVALEPSKLEQYRSDISEIMGQAEVDSLLQTSTELKRKMKDRMAQLADIKRLEKKLLQFCEMELFKLWKKTQSRQFIELQFKKNMNIDQKMNQLNIQIGS